MKYDVIASRPGFNVFERIGYGIPSSELGRFLSEHPEKSWDVHDHPSFWESRIGKVVFKGGDCKEEVMMDIVRSQVIEMIALQATSIYTTQHAISWRDMEVKPTYDETWFWDNFNDMVDQACMVLKDAVEAWVTVEYEEDIVDIIERHADKGV